METSLERIITQYNKLVTNPDLILLYNNLFKYHFITIMTTTTKINKAFAIIIFIQKIKYLHCTIKKT